MRKQGKGIVNYYSQRKKKKC